MECIDAGEIIMAMPFGKKMFIRLRRSAAMENLFKLLFLHPFLASKIHNNTFKTNIG